MFQITLKATHGMRGETRVYTKNKNRQQLFRNRAINLPANGAIQFQITDSNDQQIGTAIFNNFSLTNSVKSTRNVNKSETIKLPIFNNNATNISNDNQQLQIEYKYDPRYKLQGKISKLTLSKDRPIQVIQKPYQPYQPSKQKVNFYRGKCPSKNLFSCFDSNVKNQKQFKLVQQVYRDKK